MSYVLLSCSLAMAYGCGEDPIYTYQAPKSPPYQEPAIFTQLSDLTTGNTTSQPAVFWTVPEGWVQAEDRSGFLTAVFTAETDAGPVRITVSQLGGDGGGILANINRWRGQVGLPAITEIQQQPMTPIDIAGQPAGLLDLAANDPTAQASIPRMLIAFLPRPSENRTWYFKMTGKQAGIDAQRDNFMSFLQSFGFQDDGPEDAANLNPPASSQSGDGDE